MWGGGCALHCGLRFPAAIGGTLVQDPDTCDSGRLKTLKSETGCQHNYSVHLKSLKVECKGIDSSFDNRMAFCTAAFNRDFVPVVS